MTAKSCNPFGVSVFSCAIDTVCSVIGLHFHPSRTQTSRNWLEKPRNEFSNWNHLSLEQENVFFSRLNVSIMIVWLIVGTFQNSIPCLCVCIRQLCVALFCLFKHVLHYSSWKPFFFVRMIFFPTCNIFRSDFEALNAFKIQNVLYLFFVCVDACWMKRNINWRVTSDFQLIKRLTMASKWHDRP